MTSAGMKDAKRSWRPQFLHALLMRVSFKRIHSQASGLKSAVDFKWAEQFNRWDIQLQECPLFEDRLLLRGYKYKAAAVCGVWRIFFCFSVRFLYALSELNHHPRLFWLALNTHSSSVHLSLVSVLPAHSHFPPPPRAHRACCAPRGSCSMDTHSSPSLLCMLIQPASKRRTISFCGVFSIILFTA